MKLLAPWIQGWNKTPGCHEKYYEGENFFCNCPQIVYNKNADLILVMKDGNIVEQGTHNELLKKKGYYEQLYHAQFADLVDNNS